MDAQIVTREYEGLPINFTGDGYFNATQAAAKYGKRPYEWLRQQETQGYIATVLELMPTVKGALITKSSAFSKRTGLEPAETLDVVPQETHLTYDELVVTTVGGTSPGTWLHPKLAIAFARWLDVRFSVWCDTQIDMLLRGQTEEALANVEKLRNQVTAMRLEHQKDMDKAAQMSAKGAKDWFKDSLKAQRSCDHHKGVANAYESRLNIESEVRRVVEDVVASLPKVVTKKDAEAVADAKDRLEDVLAWRKRTLRAMKAGDFFSSQYEG